MNPKLLQKIETLKNLYDDFSLQYHYYFTWTNEQKDSAFLATQKKSEELVEYSIKINRELLKVKNIFAHSYRESFVLLKELKFNEDFAEKLGELALFRNRLAHEYLTITEEEIKQELEEIKELYPKYIKELFKVINN